MAHKVKAEAIILAAGLSSRMGQSKALLDIDSRPFLQCLVESFREAGTARIVVVTGHRQAAIMPLIKRLEVDYVFNPRYREEMIFSVTCGVQSLKSSCEAFFVAPVDVPEIQPSTIKKMLDMFQARPSLVIYPCHTARRGHPPLLCAALKRALLEWHGVEGLQGFLRSYEDQSCELPVDDPGCLKDYDTPEDLLARGIVLNQPPHIS